MFDASVGDSYGFESCMCDYVCGVSTSVTERRSSPRTANVVSIRKRVMRSFVCMTWLSLGIESARDDDIVRKNTFADKLFGLEHYFEVVTALKPMSDRRGIVMP